MGERRMAFDDMDPDTRPSPLHKQNLIVRLQRARIKVDDV